MQRNLVWILFALTFASPVRAAQVLRVGSSQKILAISHEDFRQFKMKDNVCVVQGGKDVACGLVVKITPKGAIVKLETKSNDVSRGDQVRLAPTSSAVASAPAAPPGRKPALALLDSVEADVEETQTYFYNLSGGLTAGISSFFPAINFQRTLSPSFALGLMPMGFRGSQNDTTVTTLGVFLTGNYYGNDYFRGMWIQGGAGVFLFDTLSGEISESATTPAFLATAGWRGYWDLGFNIGVGAGIQYIVEPDIINVSIGFDNLQPLVVLDIGFNF